MTDIILLIADVSVILVVFYAFRTFNKKVLAIYKRIFNLESKISKILTEVIEISPTVDGIDEVVYRLERYNDMETLSHLRNTLIAACKRGRVDEIQQVSEAFDSMVSEVEAKYQIELPETASDIRKNYGCSVIEKVS